MATPITIEALQQLNFYDNSTIYPVYSFDLKNYKLSIAFSDNRDFKALYIYKFNADNIPTIEFATSEPTSMEEILKIFNKFGILIEFVLNMHKNEREN